jgi:hypothetical protein
MHSLLFLVCSRYKYFCNFYFNILGTQYVHGNIGATIYIASGNTVDWTFGTANVTFSYAVELRDTGK